ncbi:MAG: aminopeptidase P family protein [Solirubrobacterales bacterium]|nr:MAG: aminopeptidase P family protein [Solirubrobacterales bacterium]
MLVSALVNVRYLTGYTGSNGLALIGARTRTFITDFRYVEQAAKEVHASFARVRAPVNLLEVIDDALPAGELRLGFEEAHVTVAQLRQLRELLPERVELVAVGRLLEGLRAVKEPEEVQRIKAATGLADAAFERLVRGGLIGRTERELAIELERDMRQRGAQRASFETIVAAGAHGALPHAQPRDVEIRRGELVVIDWGAELDGYCSDCTRTVAAGEPGADARSAYELVLEAQLAGLAAVKAGVSGRDADAAARDLIEAAGQGEHFGHGLGHGVGLEIHEGPRLSWSSEDDLDAGNVVTVEPGVYLPGRFGIRTEDLVVVREGGCEVLTSVTKRLIVTD